MTTPHRDHESLDLSAVLDRRLINTAGRSVRHLIVTLQAPEARSDAETERLPLNLGMVIDASGSMDGQPLLAAKAATLDVIQALETVDHFSLVSFASDVQVHTRAVRLDPRGREAAAAAVRPLVARASTALCDGWLGGCEAVATRQAVLRHPERHHVVLLSDGHANEGECDPAVLARHAHELRQRGIVTSTVGIGENYSPTQLQAIAEAGGGRMHDADLPEEIARVVMAELNDTLATTVENLELRIGLPAGVTAELYGTAPLTQHGERCDILLGSMLGGSTRKVVVKLTFPAGTPGSLLSIAVKARWTVPGQAHFHSRTAAQVEAEFAAAEECLRQRRDLATARIVAEQWQAFIVQQAMRLNQDGQYREAAAFAATQERHFRRYCEGVPALESLLDGLDRFAPSLRRRYSAMTSKEMMLGSYKTSRWEENHRSHGTAAFKDLLDQEDRHRRGS